MHHVALCSVETSIEMAVARRKRGRSSTSDGSVTQSKHKIGYRTSWKTDFPWHIPVYDDSEPTVIGLLCSICK